MSPVYECIYSMFIKSCLLCLCTFGKLCVSVLVLLLVSCSPLNRLTWFELSWISHTHIHDNLSIGGVLTNPPSLSQSSGWDERVEEGMERSLFGSHDQILWRLQLAPSLITHTHSNALAPCPGTHIALNGSIACVCVCLRVCDSWRTLSYCNSLCHSAVACFTGIMDPNASQVRIPLYFLFIPVTLVLNLLLESTNRSLH